MRLSGEGFFFSFSLKKKQKQHWVLLNLLAFTCLTKSGPIKRHQRLLLCLSFEFKKAKPPAVENVNDYPFFSCVC